MEAPSQGSQQTRYIFCVFLMLKVSLNVLGRTPDTIYVFLCL